MQNIDLYNNSLTKIFHMLIQVLKQIMIRLVKK